MELNLPWVLVSIFIYVLFIFFLFMRRLNAKRKVEESVRHSFAWFFDDNVQDIPVFPEIFLIGACANTLVWIIFFAAEIIDWNATIYIPI